MPTYDWICKDCKEGFELVRSMKDYANPAVCLACQSTNTTRLISRTSFYGAGDWDSASYNPGLGCVVKNSKHRNKIAKERGLIEVGNEDFDKTTKSLEAKEAQNIEEAMKPTYDKIESAIKTEYLAKR